MHGYDEEQGLEQQQQQQQQQPRVAPALVAKRRAALEEAESRQQVATLLADIDLVDARWLCDLAELGGVAPRWQEVPHVARVDQSNLWRLAIGWDERNCLAVVALSYPWLDNEHPDKEGAQLQKVAKVLRAMLQSCGSPHGTIGVLWDWMSMPQHPRYGGEAARFERGVATIPRFFMHPFTHVLMLRGTLPSGDYANTRPWEGRGWTFFEGAASAIVKDDECAWNFAMWDGASTLEGLRRTLKAGRKPLLSPPLFQEELNRRCESGELHFSVPADRERVCALYESGFVEAFDSYCLQKREDSTIYYQGLAWSAEDALVLKAALSYLAEHCEFRSGSVCLDLTDNDFAEEDEVGLLREALEGCSQVRLWL